MLTADGSLQIRHLHRRQRRLESLVAHLQPGAINGLLERFAGENSEGMRHSSFLRGLSNTPRDFVDDDVVVRGIAAQKASDADDGVVFSGFRKSAGGGRNFKSAGGAYDVDCIFSDARAHQPIKRALQKPLGDESVESRDNNAKAFPCAVQAAFKGLPVEAGAFVQGGIVFLARNDVFHLPLNSALRFSRNAAVPSFLSSVAQLFPNSDASS